MKHHSTVFLNTDFQAKRQGLLLNRETRQMKIRQTNPSFHTSNLEAAHSWMPDQDFARISLREGRNHFQMKISRMVVAWDSVSAYPTPSRLFCPAREKIHGGAPDISKTSQLMD